MTKKKTGRASITKLQSDLWQQCKRIVRATYIKQNGTWECFTCNRTIDEPAKAQTGHFIPSSVCGAYLRYDLRNLRIQCYNCNINAGGAGALYYKNLVAEKGQEFVDKIFEDKNKIIKAYDHYVDLLEKYKLL